MDYACAQARSRYEKDRYDARKTQNTFREYELRDFLIENEFSPLECFFVRTSLKSGRVTAVEILVKGELSRVTLHDDVYSVRKAAEK